METIDKEALRLLWFAQKNHPDHYAEFKGQMEKYSAPWDFSDPVFLRILRDFKEKYSDFLKHLDPPIDAPIVEQSVPTKDVVDPLVSELAAAQAAQTGGARFSSIHSKVWAYENALKKQRGFRGGRVRQKTTMAPAAEKKQPSPVQDIIENAAPKLAEAVNFFSRETDLPADSRGFPVVPAKFFSSVASTPIQKIFAPFVDAFLSPNDKIAVIQSAIGKAYDRVYKQTEKIGTTLAQAGEIKRAVTQMNAGSFGGSGARLTPNNALFNFFSDAFHTVFITPEIVAVRYAVYQGLPVQSSWSQVSAIALQMGSSTVHALGKRAVKETGKAVAQKAATTAIGKTIGTWLGTFLGPGLGNVIGYFLGDLILDKALSFVGSAFRRSVDFISFDWLGRLFMGSAEETPFMEQAGMKWLSYGAIALLLLVLFPLFGFGGEFQKLVDDNAFVQGIGTGGENQFADCKKRPEDPVCSMTPCDPVKQDCRWPTSGIITQGPFTACGGTHRRANAIDIGGAMGADVYSTVNGTVTKVFEGCPNGEGYLGNPCGNYYGNYVVVTGQSYSLTFGHLLRPLPVGVGQSVSPTTVIGQMDHSGSSSGSHLHFSYSGPGSINSILPFAIDHCVNGVAGCPPCNYPAVGGL